LFVTKRQKQISALVFRTTIDLAKRHVRATGKKPDERLVSRICRHLSVTEIVCAEPDKRSLPSLIRRNGQPIGSNRELIGLHKSCITADLSPEVRR
jgi:hypothetical protein